jgi:hypothetical protein
MFQQDLVIKKFGYTRIYNKISFYLILAATRNQFCQCKY